MESKTHLRLTKRFEREVYSKIIAEKKRYIAKIANNVVFNGLANWNGYTLEHQNNIYKILVSSYTNIIKIYGKTENKIIDAKIKAVLNKRKSYTKNITFLFFDAFFINLAKLFTEKYALKKATLMTATQKEDLRRIVSSGIQQQLGTDEIARNIRIEAPKIAVSRARTIARTETHTAAQFASKETAKGIQKDFKVDMLKEWVSVEDNRTRPAHAEANGEKIKLDEQFEVGGELMDRPNDPNASAENVINCRCTLAYDVDESIYNQL